jgi:glutamyl-tRNA reductase
MRIKPGETYEEWAKRVQMYEYGVALQQIAQGKSHDEVMEQMSARISQKMLHPIIKALQESKIDDKEVKASKQAYEENYLKRYGPKADHILDDVSKDL